MKNGMFYTMSFFNGLGMMMVPLIISVYVSEEFNATYLGFAIFFGIFALFGAFFGVLDKEASKTKMVLTSIFLALPTILLLQLFLYFGDDLSPNQVPRFLVSIGPLIASFMGIFLVQLRRKN